MPLWAQFQTKKIFTLLIFLLGLALLLEDRDALGHYQVLAGVRGIGEDEGPGPPGRVAEAVGVAVLDEFNVVVLGVEQPNHLNVRGCAAPRLRNCVASRACALVQECVGYLVLCQQKKK